LSFSLLCPLRELPSFPTRRSSDLVRRRWLVIGLTIAGFVVSVLMFRFVPQQFFPDSVRPELMVDMELAEGSSLKATATQVERLEDRKSTRLNSSHVKISYAVFCLK